MTSRVVRSWLCAAAVVACAHALEPAEWRNKQTFSVERAGVVKLAVPPTTLDAARPGLDDLRLLDASGREVPCVIQVAAPVTPASRVPAKSLRVELSDTATQLLIETGTSTPLSGLTLVTPAPVFMKAVRIETSPDGEHWQTLRTGAVLFRQFGAEQVMLDLNRERAAHVRLTIDDSRTRPVPITGVTLLAVPSREQGPEVAVAGARLSRREEFADETVLTVDLGARNVPLAALEFTTSDSLFTRKVSVVTRELRDETAVERTLAAGTIYRLTIDGLPPSAVMTLPLSFTAPGQELTVRIENGDSPPLSVSGIAVRQRPVWLLFAAAAPGTYTILTGNPDALRPRYDLTEFSNELSTARVAMIEVSAVVTNPTYRRRNSLPDTPLLGAAIDPTSWRFHKDVTLATTGVQQLELDLDVLSGSRNVRGDVRLVRDGKQVPYLIEEPRLSRSLSLQIISADDPKRPHLSRWKLKLPRAGAPITRITLGSSTPLFERDVRLFEQVEDDRNVRQERMLAAARWNKTPSRQPVLVLPLSATPLTDTLLLETDNGDNPPVALTGAEAAYPVARLLFKAEPGPLSLIYGNPQATAPRYDLALIADQLLAAERAIASLGPEQSRSTSAWATLATARAGVIFWAALALVVIGLLVLIAKLLPKPPANAGS